MSVKYRQNKFVGKTVIPEIVYLEDNGQFTYDVWTGFRDKKNKSIFVNDIVEYDSEKYLVKNQNGCFVLCPMSKRLAWFDAVELIDVTAKKCKLVDNIWRIWKDKEENVETEDKEENADEIAD